MAAPYRGNTGHGGLFHHCLHLPEEKSASVRPNGEDYWWKSCSTIVQSANICCIEFVVMQTIFICCLLRLSLWSERCSSSKAVFLTGEEEGIFAGEIWEKSFL